MKNLSKSTILRSKELLNQIEYWEEQRSILLRELSKCDRVLAGLRSAAGSCSKNLSSDSTKRLINVRNIYKAVKLSLNNIAAPHFTRSSMQEMLNTQGLIVATSTLRVVLLDMANKGELTVEAGSGRRATIFKKVDK